MDSLMIHTKDGHRAGLEEVIAVPVPEKTKSYCPVANGKLIGFVRDRVQLKLGMDIKKEAYGLSRKDQQMFGVITLDTGNTLHGLSIGLRNSYDKSLSLGFAIGANIFVCDNYAFSGSSKVIVRKHTVNVWSDITEKVNETLKSSEASYDIMSRQLTEMKAIPLSLSAGFDLIGRALGFGYIKQQQSSIVFREWEHPSHKEFAEEMNLYRLYMAFTESMKRGPVGGALERCVKAHDFFEPLLPSAPETAPVVFDA